LDGLEKPWEPQGFYEVIAIYDGSEFVGKIQPKDISEKCETQFCNYHKTGGVL